MNANSAVNNSSPPIPQPTPTIPLGTIYQMSEDDLKSLYRTVKERLRLVHLLSTDNINVMSVRLSMDTCNKVRRLAVARQSTLSEVVRDAIDAYCKKEKTR
jgi:hypothetical protein